MRKYQVEYSYYIQEWDTIFLDAEDQDDLEQKVIEYVKEMAPSGIIKNIEIESYKEIK